MDFQRPVRAAKKCVQFVPCLENIIVHREVAFAFHLFFSKRKAFADIHRNVGLICSVMIRQRWSSNCSKSVITWPWGRLLIYHTRAINELSVHKGHLITRVFAFSHLQRIQCATFIVVTCLKGQSAVWLLALHDPIAATFCISRFCSNTDVQENRRTVP